MSRTESNAAAPFLVLRRRLREIARGQQCLSVGFLALSLTGLMQPGDAPGQIPSPELAVPPAVSAPADDAGIPNPQPASQTADSVLPAIAPQPAAESVAAQETPLIEFRESHAIPAAPYGDLIYDVAVRHEINPYLIAAVVQVESAFNPRARSRKGACGLMQLLPATARRFGLHSKRDLFDPAKNLEAGVRYLKWLASRFGGDPVRMLAAYNAGEGAVDRYGGVPPYRETRNYVRKIIGLLTPVAVPAPAAASSGLGEQIVAAGK
ncbi:MAG TPA: lytic transglycosylase domain-containing protein [Thermoanaerobaculia bacterium]